MLEIEYLEQNKILTKEDIAKNTVAMSFLFKEILRMSLFFLKKILL